jgi:anaerobic selenocysteine-containing dehydrogenase
LDLLVTVDIAMTETAALSHYVLPALSGYESWDGGGYTGYPNIFMQYKKPVVAPEGEQLEASEIFTRLADHLELIPDIPGYLYKAADSGDRIKFGAELIKFLSENPEAGSGVQYILAKTLGKQLGSMNLASLWGRMATLPLQAHEKAAMAGFTPGPALGDKIFQAIIDNPGGVYVGAVDPDTWDHFKLIATEDGKISLNVPEMLDWLKEIDPVLEREALRQDEEEYPLLISSGRHFDGNANTQMRDPEWNKGKQYCTLIMHPDDAAKQGFTDGQNVRVITEAGEEVIELQIDKTTRPGYTMMPQGFGLVHEGKTTGANANRISKNTHRDRLAGTPLHRYIRCRVEAV